MPHRVVCLLAGLLLCAHTAATGAPPPLTVTIRGSAPANLYLDGELRDGWAELTVTLKSTGAQALQAKLTASATDYWDREQTVEPATGVVAVPAGQQATPTLKVKPRGHGFFLVRLKVEAAGYDPLETVQPFDVLWPPIAGPRPDSFLQASNAGAGEAARAEICRRIGLKVDQAPLGAALKGAVPAQVGGAFELDLDGLRRRLDVAKGYDLTFMPLVAAIHPDLRSPAAKAANAAGPPRDLQEFLAMYEPSAKAAQPYGVRWYRFWELDRQSPAAWAGAPQTYRDGLKAFAQRLKAARTDAKVLVSGSPGSLADLVEPFPDAWKGAADGTSFTVADQADLLSYRRGALQRGLDLGVQVGRRMGLRPHFASVGDWLVPEEAPRDMPGYHEGRQSATRLVTAYVMGALAGCYAVSVPADAGLTQGGDRQAYIAQAAYSTMAHFLEDRVCVADIWPDESLLWGGVFANRQWLNPDLPRANELRDRWEVAAPANPARDREKVAVIFSHTGLDPNDLDEGAIILSSPADIQAYDLMGNPVGQRQGPFLVAPFGRYPVYLATTEFDVADFALRIATAEVRGLLSVEVYANPLLAPPADGTTIRVRLDNSHNRPVRGLLAGVVEGWEVGEPVPFSLGPGENRWVELPVTKAALRPDGTYVIELGLRTPVGAFARRQELQVAQIAHQTATVDGQLTEWAAAPAFRIDSAEAGQWLDYLHWTRDPKAEKPTPAPGAPHVVARCRSAWDAQSLSLAVEVDEPALKQTWSGTLAEAQPATLWEQDFVQVGLGIGERAADDPRKPDAPWRWKGFFRDTDYLYLLTSSVAGPKLVRLCRPGMTWRVPFRGDPVPGVEEVGKLVVRRDEARKVTIYEAAIPRADVDLFKPETGEPVRLGFVIGTDEVGYLQSSVQAGQFDYWCNPGSFMPHWHPELGANQVLWGVAR